jgi:hypothetical protein
MNPARRYSFNLPWAATVLGVIFYAGLSIYMVHLASDFAGVIYIGFITLSAIFAVLAIFMIARRLVFPRVLELHDDAVLFPHGFPRTRITRIAYTDIIRMSEGLAGNNGGLHIVTARGEFEIAVSYLPDMESYHAAKDFICSKSSIAMGHCGLLKYGDWRIFGFPEPILHWVEPEDWPRYRTRLATSKPLLFRFAKAIWFFIRCFGIIILPWFILRLCRVPTAPTFDYVCLSTAVAFFITLIYHWLATIWPVHATIISFRDRGITQFFGKQTWDLNYHDLSGWAVIERQFEGRVVHILLLKRGARIIELALPDPNTRDRLVQIFYDKQILHSPDLIPSWELHP